MSADERQRVDLVMPSGMQPDAEWLHHPATLVLKAEMAALTEQAAGGGGGAGISWQNGRTMGRGSAQ